jgi:hypothetical protein
LLLKVNESRVEGEICGILVEREDRDVARIEAEVDAGEIAQAPEEESRGSKEENGERDLTDDEGTGECASR